MNAPRVVAAIIALSAVGLGGCKSGSKEPAKAAPAAAKPGDSKAAAAPAKAAPAPAAKPATTVAVPATKPESMAAPSANSPPSIPQIAQERQVLREKRETLVKNYSEMGDKAYAESRFEDAEKAYGDVLDLDPKNENARRRLDEIGAILGKRPMDERSAFRTSVDEWRVRTQQAKVEVSNLASQAEARLKAGDNDAAVALYDKALVIAGLYPGNVDFSPSVEGLKARREAARKSADSAADARRRRILKEASDQAAVEAARERQAKRERITTLFKKANEAMERNDYQAARNLSEEILSSDPNNASAKRLRRIALDASDEQRDDQLHKSTLDEWKSVFEQLHESFLPQTDDYSFPDTWSELQAKRAAPVLSTAKNLAEDPQNREVRNRLDGTRITVQFTETKLDDAVDFLHRVSGVNIVVLKEAKEGKDDAALTIQHLALDQPVRVSQILDLVTQVLNLAWNIENGVVQITTPQAAQGAPVVQLYDVKDLATPISNFPGEEINLDPKGEHAEKEEAKEPVAEFVLDNIAELITNNVDKSVWEGGGSVEPVPPGTLVVKCPAATHIKVQQLLDGLRGAGGLQVSIETRFITVLDNFLQDVGVDLRGLGDNTGGQGVAGVGGLAGPGGVISPVTFDDVFFGSALAPGGIGTGSETGVFYQIDGGKGSDIRARFQNLYDTALGQVGKPGVLTNSGGFSFQGSILDNTQAEVVLRAVEKNDRTTMVTAPRLTAYNGQRANVTVLNQQSYISDFDVEVAQAAQIGDPIVQIIRDGVILDLRPVVSADRRFITMELRPTVAVLTRPMATFVTTLANGPPVTIQLPDLQIQRVRTTVTMPDGGTLLLGGLKFFQEQRLDSSVPWLDKIPVLNFILTHKGTFLERRNLLVLIRARILRPEENEPGAGRRL